MHMSSKLSCCLDWLPCLSKCNKTNRSKYEAEDDQIDIEHKKQTSFPILTASCHTEPITSLCSVQPNLLLSGGKDGLVLLQDIEKGEVIHKWTSHTQQVIKVRSKDDICISASRDKSIKVWQCGQAEECVTMEGHELVVTGVDLSLSHRVFSGSRDNSVRSWDIDTGECIDENNVSRNLVTDVSWNNEHNLLAQTSEDKMLKLWNEDLELIHTFSAQNQIQTSCRTFGNFCITTNNGFGKQGCEVCIWDIRKHALLQTFRGHTETVRDCGVLQDSHQFITCSHDGSIRLWSYEGVSDSMATPTPLSSQFVRGGSNVECVCIVNDRTIVCSSFDHGLQAFNIKNNTLHVNVI